MDPVLNPFVPGAGTQPPELAGRDEILAAATVALKRIRAGRAAKSQMLLGLRGVGKTVLLNRIAEVAEGEDYRPVMLESPEDRPLAEMLVPPLRQLLFGLSRVERAKDAARRGLGVLRAFAKTFKVKAGDVEFTVEATAGTADSGDLESDMPEVLLGVARAAQAAGTAVALFVDEVQYLSERDLAALIVSIHKTARKGLPLVMFGAGLPQLSGLAGEAKSYAERLFAFPDVGPLAPDAAAEALVAPVEREGKRIDPDAVADIVRQTEGYPYFLQEWGYHAWDAAGRSPITLADVTRATQDALRTLDRNFFKVRLDRLTPRENDYMRAMAELGPGPHQSGVIAETLGLDVSPAGSLRDKLIKKGMIFSPQHGKTAFTVPMFDQFMRRSMPVWKAAGAPMLAHKKAARPKPPTRRRRP
jgi:hypothetical protein